MNNHFKSIILKKTGATSLQKKEIIQSLWSGYGNIKRITLYGGDIKSVVIKNVQLPKQNTHPKGWSSEIGHLRKLKSYQVETFWYQNYSSKSLARLPKCYGVTQKDDEVFIILEDLNAASFSMRKQNVNWQEVEACLEWLAKFHASYLGEVPKGLWDIGTYWHLKTRPQELQAIDILFFFKMIQIELLMLTIPACSLANYFSSQFFKIVNMIFFKRLLSKHSNLYLV